MAVFTSPLNLGVLTPKAIFGSDAGMVFTKEPLALGSL
jgi:hypothetical protein